MSGSDPRTAARTAARNVSQTVPRIVLLAAVCVLCLLVAAAAVGAAGAAGSSGPSGPADASPTDGPLALGGDAAVAQTNGATSQQVRGSPDLDVYLSQPTVPTGGDATVTVDLLNTGEMRMGNELDPRVTTARSLRLEADAEDAPFEVTSGRIAVGDVPTGTPTSVPIDLAVPDDVEAGEYDIEVTARYRYTRTIVPDQNNHYDSSRTVRFDVTVVVDDGARFAVVDADTNAQVGGSGDVNVTLENVGEETAREATVTGSATGSEVVVGDGQSDVFVGDWAPGENRTVTFDSTVTPDFAGGAYALQTLVDYRDRDGVSATSASARTGVTPVPKQSFPIGNVAGDLEVGYAGTITGEITNDGPLDVDDAVLVVEPQSDRVTVGERRYALPDLASGETADFAFDADVSGQADPGPRQVRFSVEYTSGDGTVTVTDTDRVEVAPRQPEFSVSADNATVPAGETRRIEFEVTNQRPETLSSINAGLYANSPLSAVDDEAFIDELAPGESTDVWFEVAAASDASTKTHPVELDFRYDDERGDDRISDVQQYPVEVTEPADDGDGFPTTLVVVGALVLLVAGGAVYWSRTR